MSTWPVARVGWGRSPDKAEGGTETQGGGQLGEVADPCSEQVRQRAAQRLEESGLLLRSQLS